MEETQTRFPFTDKRRGVGTYNRVMSAFDNLQANKVLYGFSIDEELMDNCREAGKEFIHINPEGYIESCALLPSSKYNVTETSLGICLRNSYLDSRQCSHDYEALGNHPCMSHRRDADYSLGKG